ncbi:MAG: chromosomal replication initiator protein DnaA [Proteobacteria bacterium]|nr:chromosomal replication initiator protein DnaA [Pseudomonadota bacterium]MBU1612553.1 chromosomal replication initiator protein DnaA [Pseudomonadota bacterium]
MTDAWKRILESLSKSLNPGLYTIWIKPLDAICENGRLVLFAPNDFVASWVRERLMNVIRDAAMQIMGYEPEISVKVKRAEQTDDTKAEAAVANHAQAKPRRAAEQMGLPIVQVPRPMMTYNWRFRFRDFVVGPSNELAAAASKGICSESLPGDRLFLTAGPGLGKTHLLQSIGHRLSQHSNRDRVAIACMTAEEFATRFVLAMRAKELTRFKAELRESVDVLLLEDVQFFQGKEKMQDELLGTLDALQARGCKVVLSSSYLPRELSNLDPQLVSRFCSGFMAGIERPDFETRRRIVENKALVHGVSVPGPVIELLAERITTDIRQLESCLNNLVLKARLLGRQVNMDLAWNVLQSFSQTDARPDFERIVSFICNVYGLSAKELMSKSRKAQIVLARNTAFFLIRQHTEMSLAAIGRKLNRRHSTVIKGITKIEREISQQTPLGRQVERTIERLTT